jgi:hypothetical protein
MEHPTPAEQQLGFRIHAIVFVPAIIAAFIINYLTPPQYWWALWVLLGWGIGLFSHWFFVLGPGRKSQASRQG